MAFYNTKNNMDNFYISFTDNPETEFFIFAKGYRKAASALAMNLLEKPRFSVYEAYPVVFLYRHAFELYLKDFFFQIAIILAFNEINVIYQKFKKTHDLIFYAEILDENCKKFFPDKKELHKVSSNVLMYAKEFAEIDENSQIYRYPSKFNINSKKGKQQTVNLSSLYDSMEDLFSKLEKIDFGFDCMKSIAQENFELRKEFLKHTGLSQDEDSQ